MLRLLEFLYNRRLLGLFLFLEGLSLWLLFSFNNRYNTYYINSSNAVVGEASYQINSVNKYFALEQINDVLAEENAKLRHELASAILNPNASKRSDSSGLNFYLAEVVNSSHLKPQNYLTLRVAEGHGIKPRMGVISDQGVVGLVKSVSNRYVTVISALNPNLMISSKVSTNDALCTVQWDTENPLYADLKYVPRHLNLKVGDTILTSGYDTVFPKDYPIGIVSESSLRKESPFYDAKVRFLTDFTTISTAYVVEITTFEEKKEVEALVNE